MRRARQGRAPHPPRGDSPWRHHGARLPQRGRLRREVCPAPEDLRQGQVPPLRLRHRQGRPRRPHQLVLPHLPALIPQPTLMRWKCFSVQQPTTSSRWDPLLSYACCPLGLPRPRLRRLLAADYWLLPPAPPVLPAGLCPRLHPLSTVRWLLATRPRSRPSSASSALPCCRTLAVLSGWQAPAPAFPAVRCPLSVVRWLLVAGC